MYFTMQKQVKIGGISAVFILANGSFLQSNSQSLEMSLKTLGNLHMQLSTAVFEAVKLAPVILLQSISQDKVVGFQLKFVIQLQVIGAVVSVRLV